MAIVAVFNADGMSPREYDKIVQELEANGLGTPDGRLYHVAATTEDGYMVVDVWENEEKFAAFGEKLTSLIAGLGITPVEPQIRPVHNVIVG